MLDIENRVFESYQFSRRRQSLMTNNAQLNFETFYHQFQTILFRFLSLRTDITRERSFIFYCLLNTMNVKQAIYDYIATSEIY